MTTQTKHEGPLTSAAAAFERELERFERLTAELGRTPVRSDKSLSRTKRLLSEAAECEENLGRLLQGLLAAMQGARDKQQTSMERVLEAAHGVQTRASEFTALLERVAELGHKAREVNAPVAQVLTEKINGGDSHTLIASLEEVSERMQRVVQDAEGILRSAEDGDWPEIVRDVKSLKQQMQSARAKVLQARVDVANR